MISFTVPIRTKSTLNLREHWAVKAERVRKEREATFFAAHVQCPRECVTFFGRHPGRKQSVATLTRVSPRELDDDNLRGALKAVRDEIARLLGVDDRDPRVTWNYAQRKGKPYAVEVTIDPRGA